MKVQIYNIKSEKVSEATLPKAIFEAKISDDMINQTIRVYLSNQRSASATTKNRAAVRGTTKKVWAQKGTGNARHGSRKAPIFVGGGVTHGPDGSQNYSLKINKKVKRQALNSVFSKFAKEKKILIIDDFSKLTPKTKVAIKLITGLKAKDKVLSESKKIGIITGETISNVKQAFGNIPKINLLSLKSLNIYDLSNQGFLILNKKALDQLAK